MAIDSVAIDRSLNKKHLCFGESYCNATYTRCIQSLSSDMTI